MLKLLPEISFESSNIQIVMLALLEAFRNSVHSLLNVYEDWINYPPLSIAKCFYCQIQNGYKMYVLFISRLPMPILTHIPLLN